ncbi:MAG: hypothetical protein ABIS26_00540 [Candidatus Paceibacterota bacterium]
MLENLDIKRYKALKVLSFLFVFFTLWRTMLFIFPPAPSEEINWWSFAWGASYQIIALIGSIAGFTVAKSWGGRKSLFGRVILSFAFGLLLQSVGQAIASYYVYKTGEIPYPGLDDIGFFGSVIFYIYGVFALAKVSGVRFSLVSASKKIQAIVIPIVLLVLSYLIFLKDYEFDWSQKLKVFLDFAYPLGQALYIAIAILVFLLSKKILGGMMRKPIMFIIIALIIQFISDFTFLYQATNNLYIPEGVNDCMYFISYFFMSLSLIQLGIVFDKIKNS